VQAIAAELLSSAAGVAHYNATQAEEYDASLTINGGLPPALRPYADADGHLTLRGSVATLRLLAALLEANEEDENGQGVL